MANIESKSSEFKLPASSLDEVFKVVQGYASIGKMASLSDVSKNTGMHETSISKNVGFLLSIGIIEGGRNKAPTELGKKLGFALMHSISEEVESILAEIVAEDEFLKNVLAAVRIRKGMDETALRAHIAYSAGMSKTGSTTTGTGAIVELLRRSGNLKVEDGKLVTSSPIVRAVSEPVPITDRNVDVPGKNIIQTIEATSPFSISIRIEVSCVPKDLDELGVKLRKVVDDFSRRRTDDAIEE